MKPEEQRAVWLAEHRDDAGIRQEHSWFCPRDNRVVATTYRDGIGQLLLWLTAWSWGRPGDREKRPAIASLLVTSDGQKTPHATFACKCPRCHWTALFTVNNGAVTDVQWHPPSAAARVVDP